MLYRIPLCVVYYSHAVIIYSFVDANNEKNLFEISLSSCLSLYPSLSRGQDVWL